MYFSIGENNKTVAKEIVFTDEMNPAYLMLYEHINEKIDAWGDPTFIFKITQTKDASGTILTAQRTHIVALTFDDDGKLNTDNILGTDYNNWYQESTDETETVNSSTVREYMGMYHIDRKGKIRLEPGTYQITRVPVSRYEFVASTYKRNSEGDVYNTNKHTETNKSTGTESAVTITIPANDTGIVHYYDKVAYYDKFTHADTKINKFYKLNETTKANETAKGISVEYSPKISISADTSIQINVNAHFKAYFINSDGTKRPDQLTQAEKQNLVIDTKNISGITYDNNSHSLSIISPTGHTGNVYTLTAQYKKDDKVLFSTDFDIVFASS